MENEKDWINVYLAEYEKLKDEQIARIGFRDNLLYVTLGIFGAIISFVASNTSDFYGVLVLPLVCIVLGWTYLVNDEKITAIGFYVQTEISQKINSLFQTISGNAFYWEDFNRLNRGRKRRKINQFIVNELSFVFSGISSLIAFLCLQKDISHLVYVIVILEFIGLLILGVEFFVYADFFNNSET
ncbi:MAG: hypothetical protein AAGC93_24810 [Cyanobacteria bacterium P01_F01_bin.53]